MNVDSSISSFISVRNVERVSEIRKWSGVSNLIRDALSIYPNETGCNEKFLLTFTLTFTTLDTLRTQLQIHELLLLQSCKKNVSLK